MANTPVIASSPMTTRFDPIEEALCLPEILELILSFCLGVDGWKTLFKAVQVNRLWRKEGTKRLWANTEAARYLLRVPHDQRQIYASKLLTIHINNFNIKEYCTEFKGLEFSRLRELDVVSRFGDFEMIKQYCVPSLHRFGCLNTFMQPSSVIGYLHNCPQLKSIHTDLRIADTRHLLDALKHLPLLQELKLSDDVGKGDISGDLLLHLAQSKHMTTLELSWSWEGYAVEHVMSAKVDMRFTPFPALESLILVAPSTATEGFVHLFGNVTSLDLILSDSTIEALCRIARLTTLTRLSLSYKQKTCISAGAMRALAALSKLQTLIMEKHSLNRGAMESDISDEDCEMVASHWPDLRHITLRMECANLSTKGFISLARHCRALEICKTSQEFDLEKIFADGYDGDALFPQLRQLHITKPMLGRGDIDATRFVFDISSS
ncbi:hypothetical protein GGI35DRAFT_488958 [Trichoderma velutinum]